MKVQCELCREIVPIGDFRSSAQGIWIGCEACGETFFVAAGEGRRDEGGAEPGRGPAEGAECPKCGAGVAEGTGACGACGLRVDLFAEFAAERERDEEQAPGELCALWEACEADWSDAEAHDRFVEAASTAGAYAFAARRYRAALRRRRSDAIAADRLSRISRMAEAALLAAASADPKDGDPEQQPYRAVLLVLIALVLLAGAGGVYLMVRAASGGG